MRLRRPSDATFVTYLLRFKGWGKRRGALGLAACLAVLAVVPASAQAQNLSGRISLQMPAQATVGQSDVPGSITLSNQAPGGGDAIVACAFLAPPCRPGSEVGIRVFAAWAGVLHFSGGLGRVGTACPGFAWEGVEHPSPSDPKFGVDYKVPNALVLAPGVACTIDFTFDVLSAPKDPSSNQFAMQANYAVCQPAPPCPGADPTNAFFYGPGSNTVMTTLVVPKCAGVAATEAGGVGRDKLIGTRHRDVIVALAGNDTIRGRGGNDLICGGDGKDKLVGGSGSDKLLGQHGKDKLLGGRDGDLCNGGKQSDGADGCEAEKST